MRLFGRSEDRTIPRETRAAPDVFGDFPVTAGDPTPQTALAIADAFACVRALADAAASIPLIAYRRRSDGRTRLETGVLVGLLDRPSPSRTQSSLVGSIVAQLNLYGNAYIGKYRDDAGAIANLDLLAPDRVRVELVGGEPRYRYTPPGRVTGRRELELTAADVIHIKGMSTDGLVGLSPVRQARTILRLSDKLARHARAFFDNDAIPRGVLKLQRFGDVDRQVMQLREQWEQRHRGEDAAHRIAVIAGDVDFERIGMPLDDAQFLEQRKLSAVEVARIFRVPPWMIGADSGESQTYSNVESQAMAFATYALRPWLVAIEQAITADADLCAGNIYVEFLLDSLLRADSRTRADFYTAALDPITGWMTRDEVRRRENLEPELNPPPVLELAPAAIAPTTNGGSSN